MLKPCSLSFSILAGLLLTQSVAAQDRTTEQGEAAITDPNVECSIYSWPPVAAAVTGGQFPPIWDPVTEVPANDTEGRAKFLAINGSIPNIAPKGTIAGDFSNFTPTYPATDPDCWWTFHQCVTPKVAGLNPDVASVPEPRTLGYGFDDGPNCSHNAFYDYLSARGQQATMFYIGSNVLDWPLEAQRAVADGHQICVHTWSHRYMTAFSNEAAFGELWYTLKAIKLVTGVTPTCWRSRIERKWRRSEDANVDDVEGQEGRDTDVDPAEPGATREVAIAALCRWMRAAMWPPYGDVDDRIRYIAAQLGLETIIWKYDSFDWMVGLNGITEQDVQANYQALIANVSAGTFDTVGAIMLTHELNNFTMQTAMDNYPALVQAFDHVVPIAVALNQTTPYVETNYTFLNFDQYTSNHSAATALNGTNNLTDSSGSSGSSSGTSSGSGSGSSGAAVGLRVPTLGVFGMMVLGLAMM
ncbi:Carbohydrate esterase family 4 protein [Mycena sanguinolenta]|uniref:chitin deacetylase n=1 Tax=Mycena sanguinolenta TaxID=230812 RepID=A0A8H6YMN7_9AGAR|nr:Carbohydrate esterase family 4 protein [Mycena sanguinolenta]